MIGERRPPAAADGAAPAGGQAPAEARAQVAAAAPRGAGDTVVAPLQGNVWKVPVEKGDEVEEGASSASSRR